MNQTKINIEIKLSKNYNSVSVGLVDHPIVYGSAEELTTNIITTGDGLNVCATALLSKIGVGKQ